MPEAYHAAATMAYPGQNETNYNIHLPPWKVLDLPFDVPSTTLEEDVGEGNNNMMKKLSTDVVDWETFDFGADESLKDTVEDEGKEAEGTGELDIDAFFRDLQESDGDETSTDSETESDADDAEVDPNFVPIPQARVLESELHGSQSVPQLTKPFCIPTAWLSKPEFANHVGHEVWSKYDPYEFISDEYIHPDDVAFATSMKYVMALTGEYLTDHTYINKVNDEYKYWEKLLMSKLRGEEAVDVKDPIPLYLTPDKNRGVEYSNEIIEMKGKKTLHPAVKPPKERWGNESFTYNTDVLPLNMIGTIREQYDWSPSSNGTDWYIDPDIHTRIEPVLRMAGFIAELKSTKVILSTSIQIY